MAYILLWLGNLAAALLLAAVLVACIARLRKPKLRRALSVLVALVPLLVYGALTALAGYLRFALGVGAGLFYGLAALTVCYGAGAYRICSVGLGRRADEPAAARGGDWPRGRLAVALAAAVAVEWITFWNMDLAVKQRLGAMRAEAGALAMSVAPPRVPDRDNAAILYELAFEQMGEPNSWPKAWDEKWSKWLQRGSSGLDPQDKELRGFLARQAPALALLHQAAAKPGCYFEHDFYRLSMGTLVPEFAQLRSACRLLALSAHAKAAGGDIRGALADSGAMFVLAEHTGNSGFLIGMLIGLAIERQAMDTLRHVLSSGKVPDEVLAAVRIEESVSYRRLLDRAFRMEEAARLSILCMLGSPDDTMMECMGAPPGALNVVPFYRVFLLGDDLAGHRYFSEKYRELAAKPYWQAAGDYRKLLDELRPARTGLLVGMVMPALSAVAEKAAWGDAYRRLSRLGLAVCRYRARHGRLPETLGALTGDPLAVVPQDPFDGQPIRYKRTGTGAVLYSIGPDMKDDGGAPLDDSKRTGDITFDVTAASGN